jgi:hypothetical protein
MAIGGLLICPNLQGDLRISNLGHEQTAKDNLVEVRAGAAREEAIKLIKTTIADTRNKHTTGFTSFQLQNNITLVVPVMREP